MDELQSGDPRRIGPYRLEKRLGSGGMGRVYLGRSPGGRPVAIKAIRAELAEDAGFRARFAREVSAARRVSGIFTAAVVDADLEGPVPWLATAYVAGPSLGDAVAAGGPLPAASVLALAAGLAEGLEAIHSAGVVHRDLKPSNVILAEDGPRLIDFGLSRCAEMSALTSTGMVAGTPGFMSPEQAEGGEIGTPSDIFSLGAVLAFAATGQGPFGEGSTPALVYRVVYSEPNTRGLPSQIRPLIERCLAKDPRSRPTAAQLLAELSTGRPAAYPPPGAQGFPGRGPAGPVPGEGALDHPATELAAPLGPPPGSFPAWEHTSTAPTIPPVRSGYTAAGGPTAANGQMAAYGAGADQWGAAQPRRPFHWGWLIAVVVVIVLAGAGAGAYLAASSRHMGGRLAASQGSHSAAPASPVASRATGPAAESRPPGAATATTLGSYLAQSASVRPTVQPAIDGVQSCSQSPASGEAAIQRAIDTRQQILSGLRGLSPAGLPSGAQLISTLTSAMRASVNADRHYQDWMVDFDNSGDPCGADPNRDANYVAGQNASVRATDAKNAFVAMWNPMARRYGQRTYSSTGF